MIGRAIERGSDHALERSSDRTSGRAIEHTHHTGGGRSATIEVNAIAPNRIYAYICIYIVLVCFVIAMRKMERVAIKIIYVLRLNNSGRIVVHSCPHDDTQQCLLREKLMAVGPPLPQK